MNENEATKKYWVGDAPTHCDHRGHKLTGKVFYDARGSGGRWGCFCHSHWRQFNGKLGVGVGQKYKKQPDGRWLKVGG